MLLKQGKEEVLQAQTNNKKKNHDDHFIKKLNFFYTSKNIFKCCYPFGISGCYTVLDTTIASSSLKFITY